MHVEIAWLKFEYVKTL